MEAVRVDFKISRNQNGLKSSLYMYHYCQPTKKGSYIPASVSHDFPMRRVRQRSHRNHCSVSPCSRSIKRHAFSVYIWCRADVSVFVVTFVVYSVLGYYIKNTLEYSSNV